MTPLRRIILILVVLQLVAIVAGLPQASYSLDLGTVSPLGNIVGDGDGSAASEPDVSGAPASDSVALPEVLEDKEADSAGLLSTGKADPVKDLQDMSKQLTQKEVPSASSDESADDASQDDARIIGKDTLSEVTDTGILSEPKKTVDKVVDAESKTVDDTSLVDTAKADLKTTVDEVKSKSIAKVTDDAELLSDVADQSVDKLKGIADSATEKLDSSITSTLKQTQDSVSTTISRLEDSVEQDQILQETEKELQKVSDKADGAVKDILEEQAASALEKGTDVLKEPVAKIVQDGSDLQGLTNSEVSMKEPTDETKDTHNAQDVADIRLAPDNTASSTNHRDTISQAAQDNEPLGTASTEDVAQSLSSAASRVEQTKLSLDKDHDVQIISNPKLTQEQKQYIESKALGADGLRDWSDKGWQVVGMDFVGVTDPRPKWEKTIVYLHLPANTGNPPVECEQGWQAVVDVNLDGGKISEAGMPTVLSHECRSPVVLEEPTRADGSHVSGTRPSFVIAETDDVVSSQVYGTAAYLTTPSYNSSIFGDMDSYLAFLLNQKWSTWPTQYMTQMGWLISTVEGCADCGSQRIPENSTVFAFTDSSVFGTLEAHRIPLFQWQKDKDLVTGTWCNEQGKYTMWAQYGAQVFNHNTNIPCEEHDNDSKVSNSIFLENWNTAASPSWTEQVGTIEAHSAVMFDTEGPDQNAILRSWQHSTNEVQDCTGLRQPATSIQDGLASGKTAVWGKLHDLSPAC